MKAKAAYKLRDILVDPRNMDGALRRVEGGVQTQDDAVPVSFAVRRGGTYLVDGHHRLAKRVLAYLQSGEENDSKLFDQTITGWVWKKWPYGRDEEMSPDYWIPMDEWLYSER